MKGHSCHEIVNYNFRYYCISKLDFPLFRGKKIEVTFLSKHQQKAFMSNWLSCERQLTNSLERVVGSHIHAKKKEPVVSKMVEDNNTEDPETDLNIRSMSNFQITAITIITTITFAAGLQLPGGFDTNGKAVPRDSEEFKEFLKCVSAAFVTSASAMFIHFLIMAFFSPKYHSIEYATVLLLSLLIEMSILFMVLAFGSGISAVLDENSNISSRSVFLSSGISHGFPVHPSSQKTTRVHVISVFAEGHHFIV